MAAVVLIVAAVAGYAVGNGGGSGACNDRSKQPNGIVAKVVTKDRAEVRLDQRETAAEGKVLEAWVQRGNAVEPVAALFAPDHAGNAATMIENMKDVSASWSPGSRRVEPRCRPRNRS